MMEAIERFIFGMTRAERAAADAVLEEKREENSEFFKKHLRERKVKVALRKGIKLGDS